MNREAPFNPDDANFSGENSGDQKAPEQKSRKLTPEETFKATTDAFKDALDPKAAIKKVKDFFRK